MTKLNRRAFLGASTAGVAAGTAGFPALARTAPGTQVTHLRTAQLVNPLGLSDPAPSLSWQVGGQRRGIAQTAYRIRVASSEAALHAGRADLWDSGRIASAQSTGVRYDGTPLPSRARAWWSVTIWDDKGQAASAAEPAWWETGLLDPKDWSAQWIAAESAEEKADREAGMPWFTAPTTTDGKARLFRLPFTTSVAGDILLTVAADGLFASLTVDGQPVTQPYHPSISFGGPPATRITLALKAGKHMLAAEILPAKRFSPVTGISVAAQLRLPRADGGVERVKEGWQTALSGRDGWHLAGSPDAGWSAPALQSPQAIAPWPPTPAVMMRKRFNAAPAPVRARLYIAALGAYDAYLNGQRVSEDRLQSESSDFRKTILYRSYDVTSLLRTGENILGALVGDGWYASYAAPVGRYPFGPAPRRLIAQLEIEQADGTRSTVTTGDGWCMAGSPILSSELYNGEEYDARRAQPGWDAPGFDDAGWTACWNADAPPGRLTAQTSPAVRITRTLQPVSINRMTDGPVVIDFGQNFAGLARLRVKGAAGTKVALRFAEILRADGQVDQANLRAARATDHYTLRGDPAGETYLPHFTYHGFRYVQIEGAPADWSVEGVELGSDLPETGLLSTDNPVVQKLWLNTLWSQRSNFFAIPTDCPQRDERLGWAGDAQVFWDAAAFNMDVGAFTRRFMHDMRDAQGPAGAFPIFAPTITVPAGGSPGWADAGVMLPWICWNRYGDAAPVAEHWAAMTAYVDSVMRDNPDLIWRVVKGPNFGDWLALDAKEPGDPTTPKDLVATAMLKRSLDQVADMGEAIGRTAQAAHYRAQAQATTRAFQASFVRPDGTIGNGSHAGYIMAIRLGLLTPAQEVAAGAKLVADIRRRGTLLSTGFLGTPLSLDAIADIGDTGLVADLLLRTDFPSWGYMVKRGATTIWERWNGDTGDVAMNSYNHYGLGAICGFLYRRIAGIDAAQPGFATIRIAPLFDPRLPSGHARYDSVRGTIATRWATKRDGVTLSVTIPGNSRAEIILPVSPGAKVTESGVDVRKASGVAINESTASTVTLQVGSGVYDFAVSRSA